MTDEQFSVLLAAMQRIEGLLQPAAGGDALLLALGNVFARDVFTAAEAWTEALAMAAEAEELGERLPDLPHELQRAGVSGPQALGQYLSRLEGQGVARVNTKTRDGWLWEVTLSDASVTAAILPRAKG